VKDKHQNSWRKNPCFSSENEHSSRIFEKICNRGRTLADIQGTVMDRAARIAVSEQKDNSSMLQSSSQTYTQKPTAGFAAGCGFNSRPDMIGPLALALGGQ